MTKAKLLIAAILMVSNYCLMAQMSINTDDSNLDGSAMLDAKSTDKGLLPPRMTEAQRDGISGPEAGLLIFQTDGTPGYYYYTGTDWIGLVGTGPGGISTSTIFDCDGKAYPIITLGDQVWMAENLRVTHYRNGDSIPNETDAGAWGGLTTGAYCWYDNEQANGETYGALYNAHTGNDHRGLCPAGWHVPTHAEWTTLTTYLGGISVAGGKMKATSDLWNSLNTDATNSSSFSGLPGGNRKSSGSYASIGYYGIWWSSTEELPDDARYRALGYDFSFVPEGYANKRNGFSVHCLRD